MKKKIAFVWYGESTFIAQDRKLLEKHFDVIPIRFDSIKSLFKIIKGVRNTDISFCWFADVWSFIAVVSAKLFRKKSVVVMGGYDVECLKEIEYGMCVKSWWRRWMRTYIINNATMLLAVSEYTKNKAQFYFKRPRDIEVVYNGVDTEFFKPGSTKQNIVLTAASGGENNIIKLKGLDKFVNLANYIQDTKFVVIGLDKKNRYELSKIAVSSNIKLLNKLPQNELLKWYQCSKVYCQLSKVESFGMSLAEAMACECVPVVMDVGALSEIVGKTGFAMLNGMSNEKCAQIKKEEGTKGIKKAMDTVGLGSLARKRIEDKFSIEKREQKLVYILEKL